MGVPIVTEFDETLSKQASNWTCLFQMSLADGFGLALAQRLSADFVSCDHHEVDLINQASFVTVTFARPPRPPKTQEEREIAKARGAITRLQQMEGAGGTSSAWHDVLKEALDV